MGRPLSKTKKKSRQMRLKGINGKVRPTPQELLIAKNLAEGKKKGEALIAAGVSPASARSNSAEILARPGVRAALAVALDDAGITTERIAKKLDEGLDATKIISANLIVVGEDGKQELPIKNGYVDATEESKRIELVLVKDFQTRHRYLETSCKLMGLFPDEGTGEAVKLVFAYGSEGQPACKP